MPHNLPNHTPNNSDNTHFAKRLLDWFYVHGRHDLPWQQLHTDRPNPYAVWVSEIMLQQTQVATVIGYYERFMARFATLDDLANADSDSVMAHWAGLGYYARARNLHKTAQALQHIIQQTGNYPQTLQAWQSLAGIGRSTAGAIMAMGLGQFGVICDGNVKRVLTRYFGINQDITLSATDRHLWQLATRLTPPHHSNHYAQAMMDLGATLCTRTRPACHHCPLSSDCIAYAQGNPTAYPIKRRPKDKPTHQSNIWLIIHHQHSLWLKRDANGIWGDLWCPPMQHGNSPKPTAAEQHLYPILQPYAANSLQASSKTTLTHTLTHFHWQLSLERIAIDDDTALLINRTLSHAKVAFGWYNDNEITALAKPAAITKLLTKNHST